MTAQHWTSNLNKIDWTFHGDRSDSPFSDLHFHPGRFVPQIPAAIIGFATNPGEIVLDPFCGAGTTLIEAQRLNRFAIGIDLNPVSCLQSRAKLVPFSADQISDLLRQALQRFFAFRLVPRNKSTDEPPIPPSVQLAKWFHPQTGVELSRIWSFLALEHDPILSDMLLFCFSAILMPSASETRSWGYICDNVRPLTYRYVDANKAFAAKIVELENAYARRDSRQPTTTFTQYIDAKVLAGDALAHLMDLESNSIDLVVTSPPYSGVIDYIKSQRLTLEWLSENVEPLRALEIGARSKRHRIRSEIQYVEQMGNLLTQLHRVLKPKKSMVLVIGESPKRSAVVGTILESIRNKSFEVDAVIERKIGVDRRQPASLITEFIIVASKV
jgi:DNA modification methylase